MKSILKFSIFIISLGSCTGGQMSETECIDYYDLIKRNKQPTTIDIIKPETFSNALEDAFTHSDLYDSLITDYLL